MNRNLNPQEFGEQLSLFDAGPKNFGPFQSEGGPLAPAPTAYPDPHAPSRQTYGGENFIYDEKHAQSVASPSKEMARHEALGRHQPTEWVHPPDVKSVQQDVDPVAVEHLTRHATGLDEPEPLVTRMYGKLDAEDGNHRVNAALRRGQLLMPMKVADADRMEKQKQSMFDD